VTFTLEVDVEGSGKWTTYRSITVEPHGYAWHVFPDNLWGAWIRIRTDVEWAKATAYCSCGPGGGVEQSLKILPGSPRIVLPRHLGGSLRPLGDDRGTLLFEPAGGQPVEFGKDLKFKAFHGRLPPEPKRLVQLTRTRSFA